MPSTRTQVYFTAEQRRRIDELVAREGVTLAEVIRRALDQYLDRAGVDSDSALEATFGRDPNVEQPSRTEWARG